MQHTSLFLLYLSPLIGCILLNLGKKFDEKFIIKLSFTTLIVPMLFSFYTVVSLLINDSIPKEILLYNMEIAHHQFKYTLWIDLNSIIFLFLTHVLALFVINFSYTYLSLEKGFQRFFSTIQLFIFGMYVLSLAGSIDIFFAGWEIVGLSSFLLIAFYRAHNRSVINAWRVLNIYRVCDLGLLIGAVIGQVFFHEATRFSFISQLNAVDLNHIAPLTLIILSLFMILAAVGKSAQFPFYNWPSRAMEGPTPSSAIFYGALSIHAGVFLLIRTHPLWSNHLISAFLVGLIGATTFFLSTIQSGVQANIKGQIAYSITAQIGLMFIELSLGLTTIAIFHLLFHALYRCSQLLVSPSVVLTSLTSTIQKRKDNNFLLKLFPIKIQNTLYLLASTEFNFDNSWRGFHFLGWKRVYNYFKGISLQIKWYFTLSILVVLFLYDYKFLPNVFPCVSIYLTLVALIRNNHAFYSLINIFFATSINLLGMYFIDEHFSEYFLTYSSTWLIASSMALFITYRYRHLDLAHFHGMGRSHPLYANLFFLCFIILAGMPFSPIFIAEDVILEKFINVSYLYTFSLAFNFMSIGIIYAKNYTRIFMGRPTKNSLSISSESR